jgi:16S rRNA (guanine966-N2)-methyltransferase
LGLEAASRGAASVTLVESHAATADLLKSNAAKLNPAGVACEMNVIPRKTESFLLTAAGEFDLILIDPPYAYFQDAPRIDSLWDSLSRQGWLSEESLVVIEHPKRTKPGCGEGWTVLKRKDYGGTLVSFVEVVRSSRS